MTNQINLTFIDNQSHGYLKFSKYDLDGLNIDIKEFSKYSFYNDSNACYYFEEDCDASKLQTHLRIKGYQKFNYNTEYVKSNYFDKPIFSRINV
jgi:hypothetical protein|tara:strand:- start:19 stop:300 length:282 start_codon:yes stop_codon:yes gene_type:complete